MLDLNPDAASPAPGVVQDRLLRAPLFSRLVQNLGRGGRRIILDLGPARSGTVAFCNRFRCRLDIADLPRDFDSLTRVDGPVEFGRCVDALLPGAHAERADTVLCWDLLNYLERPLLAALMDRVAARARPGTLVHALNVYSAACMPRQPGTWHAVFDADAGGGARLVSVSVGPVDREAPRYTPDDLRRCLPAFRLERGVMLSNGMQEFLFRL